jgi:hypothetical protein
MPARVNQYTEDPLLYTYSPKPKRFGRLVAWRDRIVGMTVILALIVGLWFLVFHDSTTYTFTDAHVRDTFKVEHVEETPGYTEYSRFGSAPVTMILRTGATDSELDDVVDRIRDRMAIATEELAQEFPNEHIRGSEFEFHNLIIFCGFAQNCGVYKKNLLRDVQRLNLLDPNNPDGPNSLFEK